MAMPSRLMRKFGSYGTPAPDRPKSMPMDKASMPPHPAAMGKSVPACGPSGKNCREEMMMSRHDMTEITPGDKAARVMGRYGKGR